MYATGSCIETSMLSKGCLLLFERWPFALQDASFYGMKHGFSENTLSTSGKQSVACGLPISVLRGNQISSMLT